MNYNSGLKFSNLDSDRQSDSDEIKSPSLADLLAAHNHEHEHGEHEHEEHEHEEHEHEEHEHEEHEHGEHEHEEHEHEEHEHEEHEHGEHEHEEHEHGEHDYANSDSTSNQNQTFVSANFVNPPTATINVNYHGFSQEAENAFEYAVTIWEGWIKSDVAIEVDAYWQDLSQYGSGVLGAASPYSFRRNFTGATEDNTYYAMPLANHLAGEDLNGSSAEIEAYFNSDFSKWDFGTDGNTPKGKYDFSTVVLHELGHGFGLTDFINYNNGIGSYGNTIFENFVVNGNNQNLNTFTNNSEELGSQLTSNNLFFNGVNATQANGGEQVRLYAPGKWEYGSSVAHFDEKTYTKGDAALMTPYFKGGEAIHNPGAITLGVLEDLGWDINKIETKPVIEPAPPEAKITILPPTPVVETTPTTIPVLDFDTLESYGGQDKEHTLNISADRTAFELNGNSWKKLAIDYNITSDTILEFDYNSINEGEIQGIGFDTDNNLGSSDAKNLFRLAGTQNNFGITDFEYQINSGWQSYQISVGDYFTGNFNYLTFANDHDVSNADAHSQFRNLRLYEQGQQPVTPVDTTPQTPTPPEVDTTPQVPTTPVETQLTAIPTINFDSLESYGGQDKEHTLNISADRTAFELNGNSWKKLAIDYNITSDTILEFEYNSINEGEIQGIGFDTDNNLGSSDAKNLFRLAGTQNNFGITDFEYQTNSDWQSYQISVGDYFTGNFNYLTFANDHDVSNADAHSQFRNLRLYEQGQQPVTPVDTTPQTPTPPEVDTTPQVPTTPVETQLTAIPTINFDSLESYGGQDKEHTLNISADRIQPLN